MSRNGITLQASRIAAALLGSTMLAGVPATAYAQDTDAPAPNAPPASTDAAAPNQAPPEAAPVTRAEHP